MQTLQIKIPGVTTINQRHGFHEPWLIRQKEDDGSIYYIHFWKN